MMIRGFRDLGVKQDNPSPSRIAYIEGQRISQASIDFLTFLVRNVDGNRSKLHFRDISQLMPNGENTILFNNYVRSDGFAIDFVFNRRRKDSTVRLHDLTLQDFTYSEVESTSRPTFINPGRKSVIIAAVGLGDSQQIRRCSTKEYYTMTGSKNYQKKMERLKNE
ncbi:uncharacterized protein BX663DRAFT_572715 [Cokeromyces recurvatus]|uniref:uncharacterized protein n=1 Tax=Cokeromyces recurvatus TaxID=90255 RepID=UPI00221ED00B|nr:uncharacterized protein BX663DRAFT_572715 [Cokeromyces recurvatus]KAI7906841.1 hypothetical protein BX663DRAFT_572715 [Cokeromyces recurvatus]